MSITDWLVEFVGCLSRARGGIVHSETTTLAVCDWPHWHDLDSCHCWCWPQHWPGEQDVYQLLVTSTGPAVIHGWPQL